MAVAVELVERQQRQVLAAHAQHAAFAGQRAHVLGLRLQRFQHVAQRQDQGFLAYRHGHAVEDGQGQRQADHHAGAVAGIAFQLDFATQCLDVAADHIHADTAAGQIGDRIGGGEARLEDQIPDLRIGRIVRHVQAALGGLGQDPLAVQAATVVADLNDDMPALVRGGEGNRAGLFLAGGAAGVGHFQAVIDRIADQVHQRIGDAFDQALVQFGALAERAQAHLLAEPGGQVADQAREAAEHRVHRQHAHADHRFLQIAGVAFQQVQAGEQAFALAGIQQAGHLLEHRLGDHQFADQVDQAVDLVDADAD